MLHIILLILKIIGIILLCILGILLLTILCVLFVPVRYRIELCREEGEGKPPLAAKAKITWLLHLVNILIRYPADETCVRVRIFVFTLFRMPEKSPKPSGSTKRNKKSQTSKSESAQTESTNIKEPKIEEKPEDKGGQEKEEAASKESGKESDIHKDISAERDQNIPTMTIPAQKCGKTEEKEEKTSLLKKLGKIIEWIKNIFRKIKELIQNIQYTIRNFCDRIKSVLDQIGYYRKIMESDVFQQSLKLCKGELISILKGLKPQKFEANLIVGMDDPAVTGEILAIWGMLYPLIGEHVNITGDFENNRIEGHVLLKGKIKVITFVRAAIRIYFNKDIKKLIKLLKKEAV